MTTIATDVPSRSSIEEQGDQHWRDAYHASTLLAMNSTRRLAQDAYADALTSTPNDQSFAVVRCRLHRKIARDYRVVKVNTALALNELRIADELLASVAPSGVEALSGAPEVEAALQWRLEKAELRLEQAFCDLINGDMTALCEHIDEVQRDCNSDPIKSLEESLPLLGNALLLAGIAICYGEPCQDDNDYSQKWIEAEGLFRRIPNQSPLVLAREKGLFDIRVNRSLMSSQSRLHLLAARELEELLAPGEIYNLAVEKEVLLRTDLAIELLELGRLDDALSEIKLATNTAHVNMDQAGEVRALEVWLKILRMQMMLGVARTGKHDIQESVQTLLQSGIAILRRQSISEPENTYARIEIERVAGEIFAYSDDREQAQHYLEHAKEMVSGLAGDDIIQRHDIAVSFAFAGLDDDWLNTLAREYEYFQQEDMGEAIRIKVGCARLHVLKHGRTEAVALLVQAATLATISGCKQLSALITGFRERIESSI